MMAWITRVVTQAPNRTSEKRVDASEPVEPPVPGAAKYLPLQKYLTDRHADTVVLRLSEIEDLLGSTLPAQAHVELGWWANQLTGGAPSVQSRSWTKAGRTAMPNLSARLVTFDRA